MPPYSVYFIFFLFRNKIFEIEKYFNEHDFVIVIKDNDTDISGVN